MNREQLKQLLIEAISVYEAGPTFQSREGIAERILASLPWMRLANRRGKMPRDERIKVLIDRIREGNCSYETAFYTAISEAEAAMLEKCANMCGEIARRHETATDAHLTALECEMAIRELEENDAADR